jgi:hypothetical protein
MERDRSPIHPYQGPYQGPYPSNRDSVEALHHTLERLVLQGRRDLLGLALRPHEARRLDELSAVLRPSPPPSPSGRVGAADFLRRQEPRRVVTLAIELRDATGERCDGCIHNISASGLCVAGAGVAGARGERVGLRFVDEPAGREWHFVGEVMWSRIGPKPVAGLRFVGIPVELRLGVRGGAPRHSVSVAA